MRWSPVHVTLAIVVVATTAAKSRAEEAKRTSARLAYSAVSGSCPDEVSFRDLVAARLGYDPFEEGGRVRVAVDITKQQGKLVGHATVGDGEPSSRARELSGELERCEPLATALATTIAIALDSLPPPPVEPSPPPEPPPATVVVVHERDSLPLAAPPAPKPESSRPSLFGMIGGAASVGVGPAPTLGPELAAAVRLKSFSLAAGARLETTAGAIEAASGDRVETTVVTGALSPCVHVGRFEACVFGRVGSFQGRAPDVVQPTLTATLYAATGLRGGYNVRLGPAFDMRFALESGVPLVRTSLRIDGGAVWTAPVVLGGLSISLVARLL